MPPTSRLPRASFLPWPNCCIKSFRLSRARPVPNILYDHQRAQSTFGYQQAKSLVYSKHGEPNEVLDLHTYSIPPPHSNLVTLRTLSAPVNPSDVNQIQGKYAILPPFTNAISTPAPSAVPGNEACLEVIATGSSVTTVAKGDWVIPRATGLGTWRTHLQVDEGSVIRVEKEGLTHHQVASVSINALTAWRLLKDFVDLKEGDWLIQNGAMSSVGRTVIKLSKLWGFKNIAIVRDPIDRDTLLPMKTELENLGATKVFAQSEIWKRELSDTIKELTNGKEVRLGLNCVGGQDVQKMANLLSPGAQLVTYGNMSRRGSAVSARSMIFDDIVYRGFWVTRWGEAHPEEKEKTIEELLQLYRTPDFSVSREIENPWKWDTPKEDLIRPVSEVFGPQKSMGGKNFTAGKNVFVFSDN